MTIFDYHDIDGSTEHRRVLYCTQWTQTGTSTAQRPKQFQVRFPIYQRAFVYFLKVSIRVLFM
jgi:hypothetical protein